VYEVDPLDESVGDLPDDLLADFAELRAALAVSPGTVGQPFIEANPSGIRTVVFGRGGQCSSTGSSSTTVGSSS
jgi:hypothetical protein